MKFKVKCIMENGYFDVDLNRKIMNGEEYEIGEERAIYLQEHNAIEILEEVKKEEPKEEIKEEKKEVKSKKKKVIKKED